MHYKYCEYLPELYRVVVLVTCDLSGGILCRFYELVPVGLHEKPEVSVAEKQKKFDGAFFERKNGGMMFSASGVYWIAI